MKKHSRGTRIPAETIGIDLGDKSSRYCVMDEEGTVVEEGTLRNQQRSLEKHFGERPGGTRVALEAGAQSAWISRELQRLGLEVIVAHPRQLRWITDSDQKTDSGDAYKLASLARVDVRLLSPIEHRDAHQQAELGVIRARDAMVRARTLLVNAARSLAKAYGYRLPPSITASFGERTRKCVPEYLRGMLGGLLEQIDGLSRQIGEYEESIQQIAAQHPEVERLTTIPGVGTLTGLTFVLTLGRAARFSHSRDVGSYLGLRPKQRQSGGRNPQLGISKTGDRYLRKLLVQCAHHILGHWGQDSALRRWGLARCEHGGKNATKRAIVAVARKLAVLLHRLWVSGENFKPFPQMV